ncbi:hypothetical protein ACKWTF_000523 [Chironomus riparius]
MHKTLIIAILLITFVSARDTLKGTDCLPYGSSLRSDNNCFSLELQFDGNLVLYRDYDARVLWRSNTQGSGANRLCMQSDGNLVIYTKDNQPKWSTQTQGKISWFKLQDDGIAVLLSKYQNGQNEILWSTRTQGTSCSD